jgi:hypothetical protein
MIRIAKNDLCAKLNQFALFRGFDGSLRSNRHVNRRLYQPMISFKDSSAGFAVLCNEFKFQKCPTNKKPQKKNPAAM